MMYKVFNMEKIFLVVVSFTTLLSTLSGSALPEEDEHVLSRVKRVIGGVEVDDGQWPWLVHLWGKIPTRFLFGYAVTHRHHYCGGSIINNRWILTAAHCFRQQGYPEGTEEARYWHVKSGDVSSKKRFYDPLLHIIGKLTNIHNLQRWNTHADAIILHPGYNEAAHWQNDIALVHLGEELPLGSHPGMDSVYLPSNVPEGWPRDGDMCIMKGWGCQASGGPMESVAKAVRLPKMNDRECRRLYAVPTSSRLCAGENLGGKGICTGDSGGPLVCLRGSTWYQAGVASFTSAQNPANYPGVFTRVTEYVDWIKQTIKLHEESRREEEAENNNDSVSK